MNMEKVWEYLEGKILGHGKWGNGERVKGTLNPPT